MRYLDHQILWAASFLRGDTYLRMEPFLTARLEAVNINSCTNTTKAVMSNINQFLGVLAQSYDNLDEIRTSELQLMELKQNASVP
jgi:hypothetical protein